MLAIPISENGKLGGTAATYTAQIGCAGCPLLNSGCYAQQGHMGRITRQLNAAAEASGLTPRDLAWLEADAIRDKIPPRRPLRLHVVGDSPDDEAALPVAEACNERTGPSWGYTHFWRTVDRLSWGSVSMLASCETPALIHEAYSRGYAAAVIVPRFESATRYRPAGSLIDVIPCPQQTGRAATCADCRLCWRDDLLIHRVAIAFEAHGSARRKVLEVIANPAPNGGGAHDVPASAH